MTPDELQNKKQFFQKATKVFRNTGRISECFYHDKSQCAGDIKQSHSIQRNGRLSLIEGEVNGQKVIYTFTEAEVDEHTTHRTLKPIGKGAASTFFGFCDYHDTNLFSPIETNPFDESDKHCFLHSYRSFAHSYHRKKEEHKAYTAESDFTKLMPPQVRADMIKGIEMGLVEGGIAKNKLDAMIQNSEYDGLAYFTYILPNCFPIACSSQIMPPYSIKNVSMNNHFDPEIPYSDILLTVLPDNDQTIIIFACFPDDKKGIMLLDELDSLYTLPLQKAISTLLITCAENTFFAPALWNALGDTGQRQLCAELKRTADLFNEDESFIFSKINFFDDKFSKRRLGI